MDRLGTVLIFKSDVTKEQAAAALARIKDVLDLPAESTDYVPTDEVVTVHSPTAGEPMTKRRHKAVHRPFNTADLIHGFDDSFSSPVWYTP